MPRSEFSLKLLLFVLLMQNRNEGEVVEEDPPPPQEEEEPEEPATEPEPQPAPEPKPAAAVAEAPARIQPAAVEKKRPVEEAANMKFVQLSPEEKALAEKKMVRFLFIVVSVLLAEVKGFV